jgi:prepilin-type N-terminal cleavage/methylation domain-containing protein
MNMNYKLKKHAFTIAEMLVALAVMGILLTAVAIAFNASAINYNENQDMFNALNSGRQAMMRMTSQLRTANAVAPTEVNTQCSLVTADNQSVRFRYDSSAHIVYLSFLDAGNNITSSYALCHNVTAMTFNRSLATGTVKSVQMSMTITVGNNSQTIASAVVLRKAL